MTDKPEFTIEKNVPMPERRVYRRYNFGDMVVGDSIFVPGVTTKRLSTSYSYYGKRTGKLFIGRTVKEKRKGKLVPGVRIWRVE